MSRIKDLFWIASGLAIVVYFVYMVARNSFAGSFLGDKPQHVKAVIIDKKNFMGNQPVDPNFSYSYQFTINGHKYTGDAHDTSLKIGDSVEAEYNIDHPDINKPLHPRE